MFSKSMSCSCSCSWTKSWTRSKSRTKSNPDPAPNPHSENFNFGTFLDSRFPEFQILGFPDSHISRFNAVSWHVSWPTGLSSHLEEKMLIFFNETGTSIPNKPATIIFNIIEIPISNQRLISLNHNCTMIAVMIAKIIPLSIPIRNSFPTTRLKLLFESS